MQILTDLAKGLEIIEPFLKQHDFEFNNHENFKSSGGKFTMAKYKNQCKEFVIGYHYSIGQVVYQFEDLSVSHNFYLDKLGFADTKHFQDVQTKDKLLPFTHILYDFDFLVDDFFKGECIRLKEIARLKENIIKEYDKKARDGYNQEFDKLRIEKAREEFRIKNFKKSFEIYKSIEYRDIINSLDERIIEFCQRRIQ